MKTIGLVTLGCSRNLVDSEYILGLLRRAHFRVSQDLDDGADICIINTCAFIESARRETIETILAAGDLKRQGKVGKIVLCGCFAQRYGATLLNELPEVDAVVGTNDFHRIVPLVRSLSTGGTRTTAVTRHLRYLPGPSLPRFPLTPAHSAYIKISEGCNNRCSYCIISQLRGRLRSRPMASIVRDVKQCASSRALAEINIIGQDTSAYGTDRYGRPVLSELLRKICALPSVPHWVRVLYAHPAHCTDALIATIRDEERICKYLDVPVQHASDRILRAMHRRTSRRQIEALIARVRSRIPGITLRTSVIVGFPGETERDFDELLTFVRQMRFEHLGAFIYSPEEHTAASRLPHQISDTCKQERFDAVMQLQQGIARDINQARVSMISEVLIDEKAHDAPNLYLGRTAGDAPEVDGAVHVHGRNLRIGAFYRVRITDALEYDLVGEVV